MVVRFFDVRLWTVRLWVACLLVLGLRRRSACACDISPPSTRALTHVFDTFLIERDMQARSASLPTAYALQ